MPLTDTKEIDYYISVFISLNLAKRGLEERIKSMSTKELKNFNISGNYLCIMTKKYDRKSS